MTMFFIVTQRAILSTIAKPFIWYTCAIQSIDWIETIETIIWLFDCASWCTFERFTVLSMILFACISRFSTILLILTENSTRCTSAILLKTRKFSYEKKKNKEISYSFDKHYWHIVRLSDMNTIDNYKYQLKWKDIRVCRWLTLRLPNINIEIDRFQVKYKCPNMDLLNKDLYLLASAESYRWTSLMIRIVWNLRDSLRNSLLKYRLHLAEDLMLL